MLRRPSQRLPARPRHRRLVTVYTPADMREFDLLEHIYRSNRELAPFVTIAPGDDMAMVTFDGAGLLAAVDQIVDRRHVDLRSMPLHLIGRKAVTRCLSDVGAMAARPVASLAAVTLPREFGDDQATALFEAMRATAAQYESPLIGGDIAIAPDADSPLVCAVTVLARPGPRAPTRRSDAAAGDDVYVTGVLGGSFGPDGLGHHLTFEPRINEAIELARALDARLHAMIDISDGLGRDAGHIAHDSNVRLVIDAASVPCREGTLWREAVTQGEDYELLFTATGAVPSTIGSVSVTRIGRAERAEPGAAGTFIIDGGECLRADELGWQHEG